MTIDLTVTDRDDQADIDRSRDAAAGQPFVPLRTASGIVEP